ncbi:MAG TPA: sugar phosphate isomerase/epimerase [Bryobacteraceae bacterium]|jgi:sugar phosphate isomerase/epimerase|nr:sugar phosphate isomerase/epimerase [Bryobacteraceae bacterium]
MFTRRTFHKLAIAAFAKINSTIHGVKIGAQTYSFRDRDLDACIAAMKQIGLGAAELFQGHVEPKDASKLPSWRRNPPLEELRGVRKKFDAAGIELYAFNYSFREDWSDEELARGFEIARALGVKYITASSNVSTAKRLSPLAEQNRIYVAFHNHSLLKPNEFARPEDFEEALAGRSRYLAINLDIGHFTMAGYDPVTFLEEHHERIITLHIKDVRRNPPAFTPFGQGDTNIRGVLQVLKNKHLQIPAMIEYEYNGADTIAEMKKSYAYCKSALE